MIKQKVDRKKYNKEYNQRIEVKSRIKDLKKEYYQKNKLEILKQKKEYLQKNREKILKEKKEYYQKNQDKLKNKEKLYYQKNKDCIKGLRKQYQQKNKDYIKEYKRKYNLKNKQIRKEYNKKYQQENKDKIKKHYEIPNIKVYHRLKVIIRFTINKYIKTGKIMPSLKYGINCQEIINYLNPLPENLSDYHIHHIKPLFTFNFINKDGSTNFKEIKKAFSPENHKLLLIEEHRKLNHNLQMRRLIR